MKTRLKSCTWGRVTPFIPSDNWLRTDRLERNFVEKGSRSGSREAIIPLYSALERLRVEHCVQFRRLQCRKDVDILQCQQDSPGAGAHGSVGGEAQTPGVGQRGEDKGGDGDLAAVYKYLVGGYREDGARPFLEVHNKMRTNGHNGQH